LRSPLNLRLANNLIGFTQNMTIKSSFSNRENFKSSLLHPGLRRPVVILLHLFLIASSNYLALFLRFDGAIPADVWNIALGQLPLLIFIRAIMFIPFRLYQGLWRYTSLGDLRDIVAGVGASSLVFYVVVRFGFGLISYPRSVYVTDGILLICSMSAVRLLRRVRRGLGRLGIGKRVLIFGAGDAGEMIVRDMKHRKYYQFDPIGFVDDDPQKVGQRIHGLRVLGTRKDLQAILDGQRPDEVVLAIPSASPVTIREILRAFEPYKIPIKTLPNIRDILNGDVSVSNIRNLSIEDLLSRAPVGIGWAPVRKLVENCTVLVTGAGGSIGSEICRQLFSLNPKALLLVERYENALFAITNELTDAKSTTEIVPIIADVTDWNRILGVFAAYRPAIVFHAAAHKHVPLMELSPCEAVKNNVKGTWVISQAAKQFNAKRMVLISSDKAVNPSSVMGATKRVGELIIQAMDKARNEGDTVFTAVRFGNVLGSNGSVVPRFLEQIRKGGPVTVTHPEIKRFFMLIPEAVQLVLQAACLAEGGEIFVLDMGEQIKIVDLARNLIRLSGLIPDEDIQIHFTGLRPGEKLFEELTDISESAEKLHIDKIFRVRRNGTCNIDDLEKALQELGRDAERNDVKGMLSKLCNLVPAFQPGETALNVNSSMIIPAHDLSGGEVGGMTQKEALTAVSQRTALAENSIHAE
jgi:FlaA1/EpsC-like NDP-sugar epimerase